MTEGVSAPLGAFIRERRLELGLSQNALAAPVRVLGGEMRQADVSRIERGDVVLPRIRRIELLAIALDVRVVDLLTRSSWVDQE